MPSELIKRAHESSLRLLALESGKDGVAVVRVCQKLGDQLVGLVGPTGFKTLLHRSLVISRRKFPALANVAVMEDGRMGGWEETGTNSAEPSPEAGAALVGQVLILLETFIGEALTQQLLGEIWPVSKTVPPTSERRKL